MTDFLRIPNAKSPLGQGALFGDLRRVSLAESSEHRRGIRCWIRNLTESSRSWGGWLQVAAPSRCNTKLEFVPHQLYTTYLSYLRPVARATTYDSSWQCR